ncbi:MAG: 4Fe-4S dicluster domain-containing protein [Endomicrobia bacterium]|nr:4Fe-4S dicluster domain-containing protein [Endomicrobiia bacterium]
MKKLGKMLFEALASLFKKPATSEYPYKKRPIHGSIAGMISFEQPKCIGCGICVRNCPASAIKIKKTEEDKVFSCELSLANCIFCSQCVLTCPKKALKTTDNFELAQIDKSKLTIKLEEFAHKTESVEPIKQQEEQTAKNNAIDDAENTDSKLTVKLEELVPQNKKAKKGS